MRLILELRQSGITDTRLLNAVESLPRDVFIPADLTEYAFENIALPIACGQTISRPSIVADMIDALKLGEQASLTVLEIGTGTGYATALISKLSKRVYTIERYRTLLYAARKRFSSLGLQNIVSQCADGNLGWAASAPFDRIISTCAAEDVPEVWVNQLKAGGIMILPVGTNEDQHMVRLTKNSDGSVQSETMGPSQFLHIAEGVAKEL
ncbi:MAG: protein-L-isoaspartate O-methyltransferase [Ponticaulis sp.]|nr:protein-L-isoaspartate O-methyltransferase [Ponticaulis sp.]